MLGELEHILARPGMYIGSTDNEAKYCEIVQFDGDEFQIIEKAIQYNEGIERLFLEIISNAADNARRSRELGIDPGKMTVTVDEGTVTVYNEGRPISTKWHSQHEMYVPEMIFAHLRAGSNFNNDEKKTAGTYGLGAKLCACYSTLFEIDIVNEHDGIRYRQTIKNNLEEVGEPLREAVDVEEGGSYTKITYQLDFKRFYCSTGKEKEHKVNRPTTGNPLHCELCWIDVHGGYDGQNVKFTGHTAYHEQPEPLGLDPLHCFDCWAAVDDEDRNVYTDDLVGLMAKISLDFAFNANVCIEFVHKGKTYVFDISSPLEFAKIYMPEISKVKTPPIIYESSDGDTRMVMIDTPHNGRVVSFANGMPTRQGGVHVNSWLNGFANKLKKELNAKYNIRINVSHIKNHVTIFLSVYVPAPKFDGQTKERLKGPKPKVHVSRANLKTFESWNAVTAIRNAAEKSAKNKIAKATKGKKTSFINLPGVDDAEDAGTKNSHNCKALFVEGKSAQTFFTAGMKYKKEGRKIHGCFPMRGKIKNHRRVKLGKSENSELIKKINIFLGLDLSKDYSLEKNRKTLRYGQVVILVDADDDGIHIKGLLLNYFSRFKGLLESNYVTAMLNPVMIAKKGRTELKFYSTSEYYRWMNRTPEHGTYKLSYFKGLGTSTEKMIKDCFTSEVVQQLSCGEEDREALELAFGKDNSESRKQIYRILHDAPAEHRMDSKRVCKIEDVIFEELINFAKTANKRHIPLLTDGLKDSYRKIIYAALKHRGKDMIGVTEFAAEVKNLTHYKHGPESLIGACIGAGQSYPGSNNIPYLEGQGTFGSRLGNGSDHAAGRYLLCRPSPILCKIFRPEDDILLQPVMEQNTQTCVKTFLPIVPLMLINTCSGMGWGWSNTSINYNPMQIIEWIEYFVQHIKDGSPNNKFRPPELIPWWRGYTGVLFKRIDKHWINRGRYEDLGNVTYINDLPINTSCLKYQEKLAKLVDNGVIREWKHLSTDPNVPKLKIEGYEGNWNSHKDLFLESALKESNMTYMDHKSLPFKYPGGAKHVCAQFCKSRYKSYVERKEVYGNKLRKDLEIAKLRLDFVLDVVEGRLDVRGKNKSVYEPYMLEKGYPDSFLNMSYRSFTQEKAEKLRKDIQKIADEVRKYEETHPGDLWLEELYELKEALHKLYPGQWEFLDDYGLEV